MKGGGEKGKIPTKCGHFNNEKHQLFMHSTPTVAFVVVRCLVSILLVILFYDSHCCFSSSLPLFLLLLLLLVAAAKNFFNIREYFLLFFSLTLPPSPSFFLSLAACVCISANQLNF